MASGEDRISDLGVLKAHGIMCVCLIFFALLSALIIRLSHTSRMMSLCHLSISAVNCRFSHI